MARKQQDPGKITLELFEDLGNALKNHDKNTVNSCRIF